MNYLLTAAQDPLGTLLYTVTNTLSYKAPLDLVFGILFLSALVWPFPAVVRQARKKLKIKQGAHDRIMDPVCAGILFYLVLSAWYWLANGSVRFSPLLLILVLLLGVIGRLAGDKLTQSVKRRMEVPAELTSFSVILLLSSALMLLLASAVLLSSLYFEVYYYSPYFPTSGV